MYHYLAYPFDVAKTNRILNSGFDKECGGNITKEMNALLDRGKFRNGLFRGGYPLVGCVVIQNALGGFNFDVTGIRLLAYTTLSNPLNTLMTHR